LGAGLGALVEAFDAQPLENRRRLREALEADPGRFLPAAVAAWRGSADSRGRRYLVSLLAANDLLFEAFLDARLSVAEAVVMAREAAVVDPMLDLQLARRVVEHTEDEGAAARLLEVLEAVVDGPRVMPVLTPLLAHTNPRLRSKVALLIGKANRNAHWVGRQMTARDARVRANAIEAMWGVDSDSSREVFWEALEDDCGRVAGNAAVGLYLQGETRSIPALLAMAAHADPDRRASAAWCMGEVLDPRFLVPLRALLSDGDGRARQNALRAISRIRQRITHQDGLPRLRVALLQAARSDNRSRRLAAVAADPHWAGMKLLPTHFVAFENGWPAQNYEVRRLRVPDALAFGFALPRLTDTQDPLRTAVEGSLLACCRLRRRTDGWAIVKYTAGEDVPELDADNPRLLLEPAEIAGAITQRGPRQGGLTGALRRLLFSLALARAGRHLVIVGDAELLGAESESIRMGARAAGVAIHGIGLPLAGGETLANLCRATGGVFLHAVHVRDVARLIEHICLGLLHRYEVLYRLDGAGQDSALVRLEVHTAQGSGADECRV